MLDLFLLKRARNDLRKIRRDTVADWGESQATAYMASIDAAFDKLRSFPESAPACDWIREGYRRQPVGRHVVYYRIDGRSIFVSRVLHQKRDVRKSRF